MASKMFIILQSMKTTTLKMTSLSKKMANLYVAIFDFPPKTYVWLPNQRVRNIRLSKNIWDCADFVVFMYINTTKSAQSQIFLDNLIFLTLWLGSQTYVLGGKSKIATYKFAIFFERLVIFNVVVFIDCKMMNIFEAIHTQVNKLLTEKEAYKKVAILYVVLYHFSVYVVHKQFH